MTRTQATHALYLGDVYLAYELYTRARVHKMAHELAITYLAPEAVLRDDLDLLSNLFTVLDESLVEDFGVGGQVRNRVVPRIYSCGKKKPKLISYILLFFPLNSYLLTMRILFPVFRT